MSFDEADSFGRSTGSDGPKKRKSSLYDTLDTSCSLEDLDSLSASLVQEAVITATKIVNEQTADKLKKIPKDHPDDKNVPNIEWPSCRDFCEEIGILKIEEFIKTWDRSCSWLYCVDCISKEDLEYDVRYQFRVRWSQPTRRKPIPRAIACVYFTIDVSKIKPMSWPVEVSYVFEGNRLVHRPGKSKFRESWLTDIITAKMTVLANVTF